MYMSGRRGRFMVGRRCWVILIGYLIVLGGMYTSERSTIGICEYRQYGYEAIQTPISIRVAKNVLSLPIYAELTNSQQEYITEMIGSFME